MFSDTIRCFISFAKIILTKLDHKWEMSTATSTVEPRLTATSIIRSPCNYGQFFRSGKTTMDFVIKNPR